MSKPTLAAMIARALDARLDDVHTSIPGKVVRVRTAGGNVTSIDVAPQVPARYHDETGAAQVEALPVVTNVPIVWPAGGGYRITFPIAVGDGVLLVFSEANLDKWLATGGTGAPIDFERHALSGAVAVPGLRHFADALDSAPSDRMTIGDDDGHQIHIDGASIRLGSNTASDKVALQSDLLALLTAITDAIPLANDGGAQLKTQILASLGTGWPVCSSKVRAE